MLYWLILLGSFWFLLKLLKFSLTSFWLKEKTSMLKSAQALQNYLDQLHEKNTHSHIPSYKFYGELVAQMLNLRNRYGAEISDNLFSIKQNITKDIRESRKVREMYLAGIAQMFFSSIFMLSFFIIAHRMLQIQYSQYDFLGISCFLGLSILGYMVIFAVIKKKKFSIFDSYLKSFYSLKTLLSVSRPLNEVILQTGILELPESKKIQFLKKRIENLIKGIKTSGTYHEQTMELILVEIWDFFENELVQFQKICLALRMFLMCGFILPSFLYSLYCLFSSLQL